MTVIQSFRHLDVSPATENQAVMIKLVFKCASTEGDIQIQSFRHLDASPATENQAVMIKLVFKCVAREGDIQFVDSSVIRNPHRSRCMLLPENHLLFWSVFDSPFLNTALQSSKLRAVKLP